MTTRQRSRVALAISGLAVAIGMAFALIHPAAAHTHQNVTATAPAKLPDVPNLPPFPVPLFGAFAYSHDGASGKAWRHTNRGQAQQRALELCAAPTCRVVTTFTKCGAVAHDGVRYHGGFGNTRQAAERHAMSNVGGGWVVDSECH